MAHAGSSSIKFSMFAVDSRGQHLALRYRGAIDGIGSDPRFVVADTEGRRVVDQALAGRRVDTGDHEGVLPVLHEWITRHTDHLRVVAVGHRVVHGGEQFAAPVVLDDAILDQLEKLAPLAPLHQPHNLAPICEQAGWLGIRLDPAANLRGAPRISCADSPVSVWVIPTNEELMIARHTLACARRP